MISSAKATDVSASLMSAASFRAMTVTESFGTRGSVIRLLLGAHDRGAAGLNGPGSRRRERGRVPVQRHLLHGLEVDQRLVVIGDRLNLGDARRCQDRKS